MDINQLAIICQQSNFQELRSHQLIPTMIELFKCLHKKNFYEVGLSSGYYSLIAGFLGWQVTAFELNYDWYKRFYQYVNDHQLTGYIQPVYTQVKQNPSLDHFILRSPNGIGLIHINTNNDLLEILDGLQYSIQYQLFDGLILNIETQSKPTNYWLQFVLLMEQARYVTFDLDLNKDPIRLKLIPFKLNTIHYTSQLNLLFLHKTIIPQLLIKS